MGIDLSGPRNFADTCLAMFAEEGEHIRLVDVLEGADDRRILDLLSALETGERIVIGIDAPLSYNPGGGDRPSDAELRHLVLARGGRTGILPATMVRMVYLTLRGVALTRALETLRPDFDLGIVEVHPGACMILRGAPARDVATFKNDPLARARLLAWLEAQGLEGVSARSVISDHFVAACAAALGAWKWARGAAVWCYPARPPEHPYDFTC